MLVFAAMLEKVSSWFWALAHFLGCALMWIGYRRFRQRFFACMAVCSVILAWGAIARECFDGATESIMVAIVRFGSTFWLYVALWFAFVHIRDTRDMVYVTHTDGRRLWVRRGMQHELVHPDDEHPPDPGPDERPTLPPGLHTIFRDGTRKR